MSQKQSTIPKRKEEQITMYKQEDYKRSYKDKRTGTTIIYYSKYILDYKEHNILKQAAFKIMQNHNNKEYHSNKPNKQFIKYNQTLSILYKTKTKEQLLDIIDRYLASQEIQNNKKLIEHDQEQIIIPKLQNLTDKEVELIATKLQQLEELYYLQLDTDYTNKQSIITNYQQVIAYKKAGIQLEPRQPETLIGNLEILEKGIIQC